MTAVRVSIVIPCAGDLEYLGELVESLRPQVDDQVEVILVDNHVSRSGQPRLATAAAALGPARVVQEAVRGIGPARNAGARSARGEILAFVDSDDVVAPQWVAGLTATVRPGVIAAGRLEYQLLNPAWLARTRGHPRDSLYLCEGLFPVAPGGNLAITRTDFESAGGFAGDNRSLEDFDFALRAWEAGLKIEMADARGLLHYRLRNEPSVLYGQGYRYGAARAAMYAELFRRRLVPRFARPGWRSWALILLAAPPALWDRRRRCAAAWILGNRFGRLVGSVRHRVVYL
jgi:glycosyltransferase involved in cell wall biosynthesis